MPPGQVFSDYSIDISVSQQSFGEDPASINRRWCTNRSGLRARYRIASWTGGPRSRLRTEWRSPFRNLTRFAANLVRFRNGERHSVLSRLRGPPVHEAILYLARRPERLVHQRRFIEAGSSPNDCWLTEMSIE